MPYTTVWEQDGVYQSYRGALTKGDRMNANCEVLSSPRFDSIKYWIVDSLAIEDYQLEAQDARLAAAHDIGAALTNSKVLMVFVATHPAHLPNIRLYIDLLQENSNWISRLFDNLGEAREWIDQCLHEGKS